MALELSFKAALAACKRRPRVAGPYDAGRGTSLDRHFDLPRMRRVAAGRPLAWLALGWRDLMTHAPLSTAYGLVFALVGSFVLIDAAPRLYLLVPALCGCMLFGPLLTAGFHEMTRRAERKQSTGLAESLAGWSRNGESLALLGLLLALVVLACVPVSSVVFALLGAGEVASVESLFATVFLSGDHVVFVVTCAVAAPLIAAVVFVTSALAVTTLVDRDVDAVTAIATAFKAVRVAPAAMAAWSLVLLALMLVAFASLPFGVTVVFPWAAHASWHAYRDLTQLDAHPRPSDANIRRAPTRNQSASATPP